MTRRFQQERFREYYSENHLELPPRFGRREWAFVFWGKDFMVRHRAFRKVRELNAYLAGVAPRHVYHSTAYYRDPENRSMKEKDWLGADLVFDLDADHLQGVEKMTYPQMLEKVKQTYLKLLDFITNDFGFEEDCLEMVFSGGRGYHLHVHAPEALQMGGGERREVVDYITGKGLEPKFFTRNVPYKLIERGPYPDTIKKITVLRTDAGWWRRLHHGVLDFVDILEKMEDRQKRVAYLKGLPGVGRKRAETIQDKLFTGTTGTRGVDLLKEGKIDFFRDTQTRNRFLELAVQHATEISKAETDEPVTGDVHRLIRTPASLHGKSGLRVTRLATMEELDDFQPLEDAVVFSDRPVPVYPLKKASVFLKGEQFDLGEEEERQELPEYAAVFALGIGLAEFGGK